MPDDFGDLPVGAVVQPCSFAEPAKPVFWIEIELVGEDDAPLPWEEYLVKLPDGQEVGGYLDGEGHARLEGLSTPGNCLISFPALDREAWDFVRVFSAKVCL